MDNKKIHTHTHNPVFLNIPIFTQLYNFYLSLTDSLVLFPKTKRYSLGQKLDSTTIEIFELLFSLGYTSDKTNLLLKISNKLDLIKVLLRLAKDTKCIKNTTYLNLQAILQEIGRMLGGWIKTTKQNA